MPLTPERRKQLDDIVVKMADQDAPKEDVDAIVNDFTTKYSNEKQANMVEQQPTQAAPQPMQKQGGGVFSFLGNVGKTIGGVGIGAAKGIMSLPAEAASLGKNISERVEGAVRPGITYEELKQRHDVTGIGQGIEKTTEQFAPKNTAEKVGFTAEKIGEFFVPVGGAAKLKMAGDIAEFAKTSPKLAKAVGIFTKVAGEGAEQAARSSLQKGSVEDFGTDYAVGAAMPVVGGALKLAGKVATGVAKTMASKLSGVPTAAIEEAFSNPSVIQGAIRKMAKDPQIGPQNVVADAESALKNLKTARSKAYEEGLARLEQETFTNKGGQLYVKKFDKELGKELFVPTDLSTKGLKNVATSVLNKFGIKGKAGAYDFTESILEDTSLQKQIEKTIDNIYSWDNMTPTGINKLRQKIDAKIKYNPSSSEERQFNAILTEMKGNVKKYLEDRVPQVAELNKDYAVGSDFIDRVISDLSLGKDKPVTAMRKLMNVFNSKSEVYRPILEKLDEQTGKQLKADIAGLIMSKWTPEGLGSYLSTLGVGLSSLVSPQTLLAAPLASPRIVGEAVTAAGKAASSKIIKNAPKVISPVIRGSASQATK